MNWHLKYKVFTGTKQHIIKTLQRQFRTGSDWQGNKEGEFINSDKAGGVDLVLCLAGSPVGCFTGSQTPIQTPIPDQNVTFPIPEGQI